MTHRLVAMAVKLAILSAAGRADSPKGDILAVGKDDSASALSVVSRWRTDAIRFVRRIGENFFERVLQRCALFVQRQRTVGRREVARRAHVEKRLLDSVEATLIDRGLIQVFAKKANSGPAATVWQWTGPAERTTL
jgi:hypothetical protein